MFGKFHSGSLMRPNWSKPAGLGQKTWRLPEFSVLCVCVHFSQGLLLFRIDFDFWQIKTALLGFTVPPVSSHNRDSA